jgi:hypothetical protein
MATSSLALRASRASFRSRLVEASSARRLESSGSGRAREAAGGSEGSCADSEGGLDDTVLEDDPP